MRTRYFNHCYCVFNSVFSLVGGGVLNVSELRISWGGALLLSLISGLLTFIAFLVYQVIFGDILHDALLPFFFQVIYYTIINFVLIIGLLIMMGLIILINLFIYRGYTFKSKITANLLAFAVTIVSLFIIGFVSMYFIFPDLTTLQIFGLFAYYFVFYSVYVLPSPVYFWYLALIIDVCCLVILYKMFLIPKNKIFKQLKKKKKTPVYKSRVIR